MDLPGKTTFSAIIKHTQLNLKEYKTHDIHSHTSEETASNQQQNMTEKSPKAWEPNGQIINTLQTNRGEIPKTFLHKLNIKQ